MYSSLAKNMTLPSLFFSSFIQTYFMIHRENAEIISISKNLTTAQCLAVFHKSFLILNFILTNGNKILLLKNNVSNHFHSLDSVMFLFPANVNALVLKNLGIFLLKFNSLLLIYSSENSQSHNMTVIIRRVSKHPCNTTLQ